ncbi:MAG: hypothetical protein HYX78_09235 [Armatimonadetes bacterium]|nr:hypothetical protein [Armatimonadota bacterium]
MKTADNVFAIDANIILRYLIPDHEELFAKAEPILDNVADGILTVLLDPVILAEVVFVLSKHYGLSRIKTASLLGPNPAEPEPRRYARLRRLISL